MEIIYSSLHNLDLNSKELFCVDIPNEFDSFIKSYIEFAVKENRSFKKCVSKDNKTIVANSILQLCLLNQQNYKFNVTNKEENRTSDYFSSIANKLFDVEIHLQERLTNFTKIQRGSLIQALINENGCYKFVIAKVEHSEWIDGKSFKKNFGFPYDNNKIWKSAVFELNAKLDGFDNIKIYLNHKASYWLNNFLEVEDIYKDDVNTKGAFDSIDHGIDFLKKESIQDYYIIKNSLIREFQTDEIIDYPEIIGKVLDDYKFANKEINAETIKKKIITKYIDKNLDTNFCPDLKIVNKKKETRIKVSTEIEILIKECLDKWEDNFKILHTSDGKNFLMVRCEENDTLKAFQEYEE